MTATLATAPAGVIPNTTKTRRAGVLATLTQQERERVEHLMVRRPFRAGRRLIEQDTVGTEFMFLLSGSAEVIVDGEVVEEISSGSFFGEGALLGYQWGTSTRHRATIALTEDAEVGVCTFRDFVALLREFYPIRQVVFRQATRLGASADVTASIRQEVASTTRRVSPGFKNT